MRIEIVTQVKELLCKYPAGLSYSQIAQILGLPTKRIAVWFNRTGKKYPEITRKNRLLFYQTSPGSAEVETPMVEEIHVEEPAEDATGGIYDWLNRFYKNIMRRIILTDALASTKPIRLISLPGGTMETERMLYENNVAIDEIVGYENKLTERKKCENTLAKMPDDFKKVVTIKPGNIVDGLIDPKHKRCYSDYWLDFVGPLQADVFRAIDRIATSTKIYEAVRHHGKIHIYITISATDIYKHLEEGFVCQMEVGQTRFGHLSPVAPKLDDPEKQRVLNRYYKQAALLHYMISGMLQTKGFIVTNNHAIYYQDSKTPMLFFATEFTLPTVTEQLLELSPKPPVEPIFLGMEPYSSLPSSLEWVEIMKEAGIIEDQSEIEEARNKTLDQAADLLIQRGVVNVAVAEAIRATKTVVGPKQPKGEYKYAPLAYHTLGLLKNKKEISQAQLVAGLRKSMPNGEILATTKPGKSPLTEMAVGLAHAKKWLGEGGYAKVGEKNRILLTTKGQKLANNLKPYTTDFGVKLKKGQL